jgi:hypothetical protein
MSEQEYSMLDERRPKRKLTPSQKTFLVIASFCFILLLLLGSAVVSLLTSQSERQVYGQITVSDEWVEIKPQPPLKASKRTQDLDLYVADEHTAYWTADDSTDNSDAMRFPDGSLVRPEVQLIDEYGTVYELDRHSFFGRKPGGNGLDGGMGFSKIFDQSIDSNFPKDRAYTTIRIRSPKPIHISKIVWECRTPK